MVEPTVVAQVHFTGTLMSDGTVLVHESGSLHLEGTEKRQYDLWHDVEGTCDPEELAALTVDIAREQL